MRSEASSGPAGRRSPRCAVSSPPCAATGTRLELVPQPGLDGLDSLLDEVGRAGLPVELHVDGKPFPLPRGIDLSAYRIVQEGLTNALKHAHASDADVTVRYRPDELEIEVRDNGGGQLDERRPRARARRHPRARQDLRRRDDRGNGNPRAASSSARAFRSSRSDDDDPGARRRRPVDGPRRLSHAARRRGGHRGGGRGDAMGSRPSTRPRGSIPRSS